MRKVLITGPDGFIGSHCLEHFLVTTDWDVVCVASWRHDGIPERISDSVHFRENRSRVKFVTHDLASPFSTLLKAKLMDVTDIVHFASDSNVDRSISHPGFVIKNNVDVTVNMLELAREMPMLKSFIQISTDEVYGPALDGYFHKEWDPILPSNPYAASKAAQEAIAISYWRTYGVPVVLTNTMNNIGERQSADKFLPKVIRSILHGDPITIHAVGDVVGSRTYLHARNHADACRHIIEKGLVKNYEAPGREPPYDSRPARFNVVGDAEMSNLDLAMLVGDILALNFSYDLVDAHTQRPGHDLRYALDGSKISNTGWSAPLSFEESLRNTVSWYLKNKNWLEV